MVITSTPDAYSASEASLRLSLGVDFVTSLPEALALVANEEKVFIVGGATIYAQALPLADTLDLTLVEGDYDADTFFPAYEDLRDREFHLATEDVRDGFSFVLYRRNPSQ
ncbi:MAG: dihydrofolate reductase [Coleofasciculaceae cyanobacterium SM2_3_26]|nr:dihydrofolate reductase [Coleofasciculaceae cyanobacterium SM2_3_26]